MNINCIICSDMLAPNSEIYTTNCGHIFHYICLIQWIERSHTCPQCRCKATEKTIHRIYFSLANTAGITDDVVTMNNKIDNLNFQIQVKNKDLQLYREKYDKLKDQHTNLRGFVKELEDKQKSSESVIHALKEQISYFKMKAKETSRLNDEIIRLKDKLKELENVQLVISGTKDEVNDMLRHNRDPNSLNLLVSTLKKELVEADRKYKHLKTTVKALQNDAARLNKEKSYALQENSKLKHDLESHKDCEYDKKYLRNRVLQIENKLANIQNTTSTPDTSLHRVIMESPAPLKNQNSLDLEVSEKPRSPSLDERVQTIKDSESPYLTVKSSNVGLSCLSNPKFTVTTSQPTKSASFTIFKNPPAIPENVKINKEYNYDGLGGHSKDDIFPSPKPVTGLKRIKSGSISSSKFRKLAPNKKLNEFFTKSDE